MFFHGSPTSPHRHSDHLGLRGNLADQIVRGGGITDLPRASDFVAELMIEFVATLIFSVMLMAGFKTAFHLPFWRRS
jgi:hypothetical protein